jgi:hypothetical protein
MATMKAVFGALVIAASTLACKGAESPRPETPLQSQTMRFEDFRADSFIGRPAAVDFGSDSSARRFQTVLRQQAAAGPNFAGHITVVTWGCGTQCRDHYLVDARSGRVIADTLLDFSCHEPEFHRNSALVIQRPDTTTFGPCSRGTTRYFRWTGEYLAEIR